MFKRLKNNHSGLSLMELLVAVAILAILVSPLLKSFVSSANLAQKSRNMAEATNAAQNVVESLQGHRLADVVVNPAAMLGADDAVFYGDDHAPVSDTMEPGADKFIIGLQGVYAAEGGTAFDALLTLDATVYDTNATTEITQYSPMDAVFTQATDIFTAGYDLKTAEIQNPDSFAAIDMAAQLERELGREVLPTEILRHGMARTIHIYVTHDEARDEVVISQQFSYECTVLEDGDVYALTYDHPEDVFSRRRLSGETEIGAIHFFYYPNYSYGAFGASDTIVVCNNNGGTPKNETNNLDFTLFLIKQKATSYARLLTGSTSDAIIRDTITSWERDYRVDLSLVQNYRIPGTDREDYVSADIRSNVGSNLIDASPIAANATYEKINGGDRYNPLINGELVITTTENRFYSVTIELYEAGSLDLSDDFDPDEDSLILRYDAAKLD